MIIAALRRKVIPGTTQPFAVSDNERLANCILIIAP
jgi:hypothetical protein